MPPDANMVKYELFYPHLGRGPCFVYLEPRVVYSEAFYLFLSIALSGFYIKTANISMLNDHVHQSSEGLEGPKDCMQQASPLYPHSDCKLQ